MLTLRKLQLSGPAGAVKLTAAEATLLAAFRAAPSARLDFAQVSDCLGLPHTDAHKATLQVRIVRLRKKLYEAGAEGAVIEAVRKVGYQFFDELEIRKS